MTEIITAVAHTLEQAEETSTIPASSLRRYIHQGVLKAKLWDGRYLIRDEDLREFVAGLPDAD